LYVAQKNKENAVSSNAHLQSAAAATLAQWHALMQNNNLSKLPELLHSQAVFRSPMAFKPYAGAPVVSLILNTVSKVFVDFVYHRELVSADGLNVVLEFSAKVGARELKGIDMIRFDEAGKIVEFEVMVRPMSGLQELGEEMARRLAPFLAAAKA
jgi:hypothetical protein